MNSLASILYSSSSATNPKKRKNLSLQPTVKPMSSKQSRCQVGMLFRSSTPKTPLQPPRTKPKIAVHPTPLSTSSSSMSLSINSPQSPRCSTPLFSKQRRTRPFIACELCRQRAFQSLNEHENKTKASQVKKTHEKQQNHHHHHSTTLHYYQYQTNNVSSAIRRRRDRRRSSIDQLLVWII